MYTDRPVAPCKSMPASLNPGPFKFSGSKGHGRSYNFLGTKDKTPQSEAEILLHMFWALDPEAPCSQEVGSSFAAKL